MSKEYINRELLENAFEDENKNGNFVFTANWIMEIVDNLPNADVAPKSEVAREIIDDIEMYVLGIKSGKEIIEKTTPRIYRLKRKDYMEAVLEYLAELKKKYTEEKE